MNLLSRRPVSAWWAMAALSCAVAAGTRAADLDSAKVKKLGKTVARFRDDTLQVVVGYRHAQSHLDSRWILLETCLSASGYTAVEIFREDVSLVFPDGTRVPMPSQKRMAQGLPDLRRMLHQARVERDPLGGYFPGRTREERLGFFGVPGEQIVFDRVAVNYETLAWGNIFFESPNGRFQPGIYTLVMENKLARVRLPIALGIEGELERVK